MTVFFSQLINGLSLGSIYALIALGYSMVYGIILLLNFAHGDVIMVGAYMSWFVMNQLGLGPVTAVCATIITCTLLGVVIEKIAYTPLRSAPRISLLITAIGVSFFLEYTAELVMGSGAKVIPSYFDAKTFSVGKVPLGLTSIITLVVTVLSMLALTFLVQKTKLGKAMRAVPQDSELYTVLEFAFDACEKSPDYRAAWELCEEHYKHYNWVHTYPNLASEVVAIYFAGNDYNKAMSILMMSGQDNDCTGGPIGHAYGAMLGAKALDKKFTEPLEDRLDTYVRTMETQSITSLSEKTIDAICRHWI